MEKKELIEEVKRLNERNKELEDILDNIPAVLYINQIETVGDMETGKNIWSNKYALDYVGYTQEEINTMGSKYFEKVMHPDDLYFGEDSITNLINRNQKEDSKIYKSISRALYHQKEYRWTYGHTAVFKSKADGSPWQFINAALDFNEYQDTISQLDDALKEITRLKNKLKLQVLTKRECEILKLIAQGLNDESIAEKLFISKHTAHTHRNRLVKKLGVTNTASLVAFAVRCGIV